MYKGLNRLLLAFGLRLHLLRFFPSSVPLRLSSDDDDHNNDDRYNHVTLSPQIDKQRTVLPLYRMPLIHRLLYTQDIAKRLRA